MPDDFYRDRELSQMNRVINELKISGNLTSEARAELRRVETRRVMLAYRLPGVESPRPREEDDARRH